MQTMLVHGSGMVVLMVENVSPFTGYEAGGSLAS